MKSFSLNGTWSLRYCDAGQGEKAGWPTSGVSGAGAYEAIVPGDVHLDLARAGVIAEPLFGTNARDCRWMEDKDWWYSVDFTLPPGFTAASAGQSRVELAFAGLDTLADVWLNGVAIGHTDNALIGHTLDVTTAVQPGYNRLVVRLDTGLRWARTQDLSRYRWPGDETMAERIWLRRAQFSGGWDWGPRLLTAGIWRPVTLHAYTSLILRDVHLVTPRADEHQATVRAEYEIENLTSSNLDVELELALAGQGGSAKTLSATLAPGYNLVSDTLHVAEPRLWWPNGSGEPYLYAVHAALRSGGITYGEANFPYGLREIEIVQQPLANDEGQSFTLAVNGRPIYCKGADWVPVDSIPAHVTAEKYRALVQEATNANCNMLRVWGGGIYEDDAWWDACDAAGILVWQDFMFACSAIPDDVPAFAAQVEHEARSVVRRLRNHASLAVWCGNNENQWLAGRSAPHTLEYGRRTYHQVLPRLCAELDPGRPYWPSSPWGGIDPNSEFAGDRHSWDIALHQDNDIRVGYKAYTADRAKFVTEYGFLAPPVEDSLRRFLPDEDMTIDSEAWRFHDNTYERGVTRRAISRYFGQQAESLPLNQYLLLAQAYQAEAYRYTLGHFRRRVPYTAGALFWMYSDCWGATSGWTIIDYYLNRKPAYYAVRSMFAPLAATFVHDADNLTLWLISDHPTPVVGTLEYGMGRLDGAALETIASEHVELDPSSAVPAAFIALSQLTPRQRSSLYCWARFQPTQGTPVQATAFVSDDWGKLKLAPADVSYEPTELSANTYRVSLIAEHFTWGLWLQHPESVKPSDNYLTLLPGLPYDVIVTGPPEAVESITLTSLNDWLS